MIRAIVVVNLLVTSACSTATRDRVVAVPVVVDQEDAWVESEGVRYATPAVVPIDNSGEPAQLRVGSPTHSPQLIELRPVFQWQSLWLGPVGVLVDMATGAAWQQDGSALRVDLERSPTGSGARASAAALDLKLGPTGSGARASAAALNLKRGSFRRVPPPFVASTEYRDATRLRGRGRTAVVGGVVAGMAGTLLMFSAVCYEECDPGMETRLTSGFLLQGVAVAAIVGGAIAWYKGAKRRERIRQNFLAHPTWAQSN